MLSSAVLQACTASGAESHYAARGVPRLANGLIEKAGLFGKSAHKALRSRPRPRADALLRPNHLYEFQPEMWRELDHSKVVQQQTVNFAPWIKDRH
jgi:hypothetical protein